MSLSQQLSSISQQNTGTVVDRKSRAKIHSRSLIFDPKVAATQDYDYLAQIALEGLEELIQVDKRFANFEKTLFNDTTVNFDRLVQDPETIKNLNNTVDQFLLLVAPYLNLNCSIKALEWLVRKFNINLYNGEMLLLISLTYYKDPIFIRILNVIPKSSFPKVFESLLGFKDLLKNPSPFSILKNFLNNLDLFKLYTHFVIDQLKKKLIFKQQLVFYLSISVQYLASNSKRLEFLEQEILPILLELIGNLLLPGSNDLKLTAFSLISVVSSIVPLNSTIVLSLTDSILTEESLEEPIIKKTLITLGQLWTNFVPESDEISIKYFDISEDLVKSIVNENFNFNKFLIYFYLSNIGQAGRFFKYISLEKKDNFDTVLAGLLNQIESVDEATKTSVSDSLVTIYNFNKTNFKETLKVLKPDLTIPDLEMILMTSLDVEEAIVIDVEDDDEEEEVVEEEPQEDIEESSTKSFFATSTTEEFNKYAKIVMKNLNANIGNKFTPESYVTFLIRFSLTASIPLIARLTILKKLKQRWSKLIKANDHELYLVLPILLLGLYDQSKLIRASFVNLIKKMLPRHKKGDLYLEDEIYLDTANSDRSLLSPKDGNYLVEILHKDNKLNDIVVDRAKFIDFMVSIFTYAKSTSKKFGATYLKGFILNQWSLPFLPFKAQIWEVISILNKQQNDYRAHFVENDLSVKNTLQYPILINIIGGSHINDKIASKEVDVLLNLLSNEASQDAVSERIPLIFESYKSSDLKFKIVMKLIDLMISVNTSFDPFDTLINLKLDFGLVSSVLGTVQLNDQVPDQSVVKRKRRSSSQTKQAMARNDINNMAAVHLRKLTVILECLEYNLNEAIKTSQTEDISCPELLIELFKVLTDLDYLGNDGHLPVLYAQEALASCMINSIKLMKTKDFQFDSNSIRADLIVNSIRNSTSPQVQNKLLLVIAELASLAPEIILHSVMPIFTFMGAHTIKQDDEFSNSALQETVSRVIPALAKNGTTNIDEDIEFLLASFVAALQHIPRHRRNKLFSSLVTTLTVEKSLPSILFLVAHQNFRQENQEFVEFSSSLLRNFDSKDQLASIYKLLQLWNELPNEQVAKNSEEYNKLIKRPIFGASILSLTSDELVNLKISLLNYIIDIISPKDEFNEINLLKLKLNVFLLDSDVEDAEKTTLLTGFNHIISFLLNAIDDDKRFNKYILKNLNNFLDMLPLTYFIDSIIDSLKPESITDKKITKNFLNLANYKFENELNINNFSDELKVLILDTFLPVLVSGIERNLDIELQQAYLDCFATTINKVFVVHADNFQENSKFLTQSLVLVLSDKGYLNESPELIISSINVIINIISILGIKAIGQFPKIIKPSFEIWAKFEDELIQTSILVLYSNLIKKLPAFLGSNLEPIILTILNSSLVANELRSEITNSVVSHIELSVVLKSLCNIWINKKFYQNDKPDNLGLYLNMMELTVADIDKKSAISNSTLLLRWLIKSFEFRYHCEVNDRFNVNTIHRLESSIFKIGINFIMKLNDKSFRPLFASLTRWTFNGEDSEVDNEISRYLSFFKFFNKLQEELKSIVTSYYSYLIEPVAETLEKLGNGDIVDINLRRILLISLNASFKYDQDDYWSQELRFQLIHEHLLAQLTNIEDSIGKYLVKAITNFVANVSSDEYNNVIINKLIKYVSSDEEVTSHTKIWTIRTLKSIFQKLGETWLSHLPTLVPYIAELLEDDDEAVELEVRKGLVRVIENVLGEPLDRYLD